MRISTEIYRAEDGKMWKITREGEDVLIEQAVDRIEEIANNPYEKEKDLPSPPVVEEMYDNKGSLVKLTSPGSTFSRKV